MRPGGFTLLEMIVVLAILGLATALVAPSALRGIDSWKRQAELDALVDQVRALPGTARARGKAIPVTSVRTGHVPGTHELVFDAAFEQVRLVHEARDRRVFAAGALAAAKWLAGRRGVFTLDDFLGDVIR